MRFILNVRLIFILNMICVFVHVIHALNVERYVHIYNQICYFSQVSAITFKNGYIQRDRKRNIRHWPREKKNANRIEPSYI
jgi:hypothetical protein